MLGKIKIVLNFGKNTRKMEEKDVCMDTLKKMRDDGAFLIDVRSPQEYEEGHLEGAILIPNYTIMKEIENFIKNKDAIIIVYCSSGSRSKKAQKKLEKKGYKNVYNLYNGLENYWDLFFYMVKY